MFEENKLSASSSILPFGQMDEVFHHFPGFSKAANGEGKSWMDDKKGLQRAPLLPSSRRAS